MLFLMNKVFNKIRPFEELLGSIISGRSPYGQGDHTEAFVLIIVKLLFMMFSEQSNFTENVTTS